MNRLYLHHKRRGEDEYCPLCYAAIKWIYNGIDWTPCDREPILVYPESGINTAVIGRTLVENASLYSETKIPGVRPVSAHRPHVCTCEMLAYKRR